ncbi:WD40 repeat-like protein [Peniophora sp. CONT]|nr:WD40 repeat-like protein [Peniophora sp. CONT]
MSTAALPILLPPGLLKTESEAGPSEWKPKRYLQRPTPPPPDENRLDMEAAVERGQVDAKALKKLRPRRTVDYAGGIGRWNLLKRQHTSLRTLPYMRPSPPDIINLYAPKAYPGNPSTSLCTKFVHTSTNKIRCPVNVVTWTPEGRRVLTGSTSGEFTLWNGLTFNFETILQAHDNAIRAMRFSHSGSYIASADQSGIIKYFQPNMNNLTAWQGHREAIRGLSFSPDDSRFVTASDDSTIALWSFETQERERVLTGHGWDVRCVEWHPYKGLLVSGSKDNTIKFWDPRTATALTSLRTHKNTVQAVSWSPSGNMVASASRDQTIRVFDIRAMKEFCVLRGHKKEVCSVAWHPIHPVLVSGGSEGAVMHWDISIPAPVPTHAPPHAGTRLGAPPGPQQTQQFGPKVVNEEAHDSNVWSLAFHPLGHLLVTASNDHTTRFWSRERPGEGDAGDSKPTEGGEQDDYDEEMSMLPGLGGDDVWDQQQDADEDGIPGFGGAAAGAVVAPRQMGPLPSQDELFPNDLPFRGGGPGRGRGRGGGGGGGDGGDDWFPTGQRGRGTRWGPGGGGRGARY